MCTCHIKVAEVWTFVDHVGIRIPVPVSPSLAVLYLVPYNVVECFAENL
jgi:hypothetical protein